jgi:SAM-dependent methyltransferase
MDAAQVGAPFDLAFSRCFLMHQSDPAKTLAKVAGLLRPGGWVVVQEPLRDPVPRAYPPCHSLNAYFELMYAVVEHFGAEPEAVNRLQAAAARAGLDLVEADGHFTVHPPEVGFELHAGTAAAVKDRAVHAGLITNEDMDALIGKLNRAREHGYEWVTSPFFLHLTLRKR